MNGWKCVLVGANIAVLVVTVPTLMQYDYIHMFQILIRDYIYRENQCGCGTLCSFIEHMKKCIYF